MTLNVTNLTRNVSATNANMECVRKMHIWRAFWQLSVPLVV